MAESSLERLIAAVRGHYKMDNAPRLLLSSFGQKNKELLVELKRDFGTLAAAIRAAGEDEIKFIDTTSGREAVAPADIAANLQQQLQEEAISQRRGAHHFDSLPTAVQLAFCVRTEAGEHVAIETVRPFRFAKITSPDLVRPTQRVIPEKYRRPGLLLRSASIQDREALWLHLLAWADEAGIDPGIFGQGEATTALGRLIGAQPPDIISRLVIPADIAQILLKHS